MTGNITRKYMNSYNLIILQMLRTYCEHSYDCIWWMIYDWYAGNWKIYISSLHVSSL